MNLLWALSLIHFASCLVLNQGSDNYFVKYLILKLVKQIFTPTTKILKNKNVEVHVNMEILAYLGVVITRFVRITNMSCVVVKLHLVVP